MSVKPYQPANGTEGVDFIARFCAGCACEPDDLEDDDGCPILGQTMIHNPGDPEYPPQWVEDADGPRCTAFVARPEGWDGVPLDPYAVEAKATAYAALPRDPATGRPMI